MTDPRIDTQPKVTYWQIIWQQFRKSKRAMFGMYLVIAFFLISIYAPFLAQRLPFLWVENGEWSSPLLKELLAPTDSRETILEIVFNIMIFLLPLYLILRRLVSPAYRFMAGAILFAILLGIFVCYGIFHGKVNQVKEYRLLAAQDKGWGLFPLIPYGSVESGFGPKVAPSWYHGDSDLNPDDIADWRALARYLKDAPLGTPGARIWQALTATQKAWLESPEADLVVPQALWKAVVQAQARYRKSRLGEGDAAEMLAKLEEAQKTYAARKEKARRLQDDILKTLNQTLADTMVFTADDLAMLPLDDEAWEWKGTDPQQLTAWERLRLYRYALHAASPDALTRPVFATRKKRTDLPGYHILGTDQGGRDVLVRMIHGGRVSLAIGFVAVGLATLIGVSIGSSAGYFGGWTDLIVSRLIEIMMCFPTFFLMLTIIAVMDNRSILNIMVVIGVTGWTGSARLIRNEVLKQKRLDYVPSAQALGASSRRIIFRHILPNAIAPVLVGVSFGIAGAILMESGLSFIGFGVTEPTATWGDLLNQSRSAPLINWWLASFPGLIIFLSVMAYNLVGEGLRDAMDPRLRQ